MNFVKVAFLNVGHGDSSVIIFPDGKTGAVIDTPKSEVTFRYLNEKGVNSLKWVIISHTHIDHAEGIIDLIKRFNSQCGTIETLYYNCDKIVTCENKNRYILLLRDICSLMEQNIVKNSGKPATILSTINSVEGTAMKILHPDHDDITKVLISPNRNNASVVIKVSFGKFSVLFTGDLSREGWKWLKSRNFDLKSDILKYPHHGGWFESIPELIDSVNPEYVILSYGETSENKYKLPAHKTTACLTERKIKTFSTKISHQEFMITTELIKHLCGSQSLEV